ncbi:LOW QUALITY PROTEIN: hypothetical protein HID58_015080 [Brassica napus]|uniref:Uncharacterized protein n=1 Tax=Brassica napus TaxID=3708 RepID=A0ABQ8DJ65_BRANA|nr:LOW QUALITY PROTEIN: hypothetical protein HID58_015080 [Brassica napus]
MVMMRSGDNKGFERSFSATLNYSSTDANVRYQVGWKNRLYLGKQPCSFVCVDEGMILTCH